MEKNTARPSSLSFPKKFKSQQAVSSEGNKYFEFVHMLKNKVSMAIHLEDSFSKGKILVLLSD